MVCEVSHFELILQWSNPHAYGCVIVGAVGFIACLIYGERCTMYRTPEIH